MGSRQVEKEVGIRLYDDADKEWYVAFISGRMVGTASVRGKTVSDCYVESDYRRRGVFTSLLAEILIEHTGYLRANCTEMSRAAFEKAGFSQTSKTRNFYKMERINA